MGAWERGSVRAWKREKRKTKKRACKLHCGRQSFRAGCKLKEGRSRYIDRRLARHFPDPAQPMTPKYVVASMTVASFQGREKLQSEIAAGGQRSTIGT